MKEIIIQQKKRIVKRFLISFIIREIKPTEAKRPYLSDWQKFQSLKNTVGHAVWSRHKYCWWEHTPLFCSLPPKLQLCVSSNWEILFGGCHWHTSPHWEFIEMEMTNNGLGSVFIRSHMRGLNIPSGKSKVWDQDQGQLVSIPLSPLVRIQHPEGVTPLKPLYSQQCPRVL